MKATTAIIVLMLVFTLLTLAACSDDSAPSSSTATPSQSEPDVAYLDGMSAEEISQQIRGKVFQAGAWDVGAGLGEIYYFAPKGNEYYWLSSSYNAQERMIAEYGVWKFEDNVLTLQHKDISKQSADIMLRLGAVSLVSTLLKIMMSFLQKPA